MALGEYFIRCVVQQLVCPAGEVESSHDPTSRSNRCLGKNHISHLRLFSTRASAGIFIREYRAHHSISCAYTVLLFLCLFRWRALTRATRNVSRIRLGIRRVHASAAHNNSAGRRRETVASTGERQETKEYSRVSACVCKQKHDAQLLNLDWTHRTAQPHSGEQEHSGNCSLCRLRP